eukprot:1992727-Alexandrium_andersonii.AAC.1
MAVPPAGGGLVDTKLLVKPKSFGGEANQSWREWRFCFENSMSCVDLNYAMLLDESAKATGPIAVLAVGPAAPNYAEIEARRKTNVTLYAALASLLSGKPGQMVRNMREKSGFELWRQLTAEYEPKTGDRAL